MEYEENSTPEAKIVKDFDKVCTVIVSNILWFKFRNMRVSLKKKMK